MQLPQGLEHLLIPISCRGAQNDAEEKGVSQVDIRVIEGTGSSLPQSSWLGGWAGDKDLYSHSLSDLHENTHHNKGSPPAACFWVLTGVIQSFLELFIFLNANSFLSHSTRQEKLPPNFRERK